MLLLFAVFAVCILSVLFTGADAYRRLVQRDQESYSRRTAAQYLMARMHQNDRQGGVRVRPFGDGDALVFVEQIDGVEYETLVYCYGGHLRELFAAAGSGLSPETGETILPARNLTVEQEGAAFTILLAGPAGEEQELTVFLRSEQGVEP